MSKLLKIVLWIVLWLFLTILLSNFIYASWLFYGGTCQQIRDFPLIMQVPNRCISVEGMEGLKR